MNMNAPKKMKEWFEVNRNTLSGRIQAGLKLPKEIEKINKAALNLDAPPFLATLTIWGNGLVEFLVINGDSGDVLISTDIECENESKLARFMDSSLAEFQSFLKES